MAPTYSKFASANQDSDKGDQRKLRMTLPPIPLERPERVALESGSYVSFKLRAVPTDATSQLYSLSVPYYNTGTPERWILFRKDLDKVLIGQNITTGPPTYAMTRRILEGAALAKFEEATTTRGTETLEHFGQVVDDMGAYVFPRRALQMEKRYMRRYMRKPRRLKMREYMARVEELNNDLRYFPAYVNGSRLLEDELLDIYEYGVPASWQKRFLLQGFDPLEHSKQEFLEFCERLEATEDIFEEHSGAKRKARPSDRYKVKEGKSALANRPSGNTRNQNNRNSRFCRLHGQQSSHDTGTCKVLLDQADKMKATWRTQPQQYQKKRYNASPYNKNTSFQKNSGERDNKKRDFNATERAKTHVSKGIEKNLKEQIDHFMATVSKTESLSKDNTLDLENFNYDDDIKSMDEMTDIEDLIEDSE
jgi:hypothetical protein